jgi:hypothetical protein
MENNLLGHKAVISSMKDGDSTIINKDYNVVLGSFWQ